ncbi:MAG: hypothetical protein KA717_27490 [Woronichinia naegeliana WA131]|uniref:Uncharacterized protein n=1 Tax=Woronichinia naegeliana WA131 TaxID=2824559 RepID=A0A977KTB8_9CYAN|nr:MAG: hypothetical protein KA717_27490 [Woronichinia naegeliana WA131]
MKISKEEKSKLGGKIMMVVEAFTQRPVTLWYTENDKSNDKTHIPYIKKEQRK